MKTKLKKIKQEKLDEILKKGGKIDLSYWDLNNLNLTGANLESTIF